MMLARRPEKRRWLHGRLHGQARHCVVAATFLNDFRFRIVRIALVAESGRARSGETVALNNSPKLHLPARTPPL